MQILLFLLKRYHILTFIMTGPELRKRKLTEKAQQLASLFKKPRKAESKGTTTPGPSKPVTAPAAAAATALAASTPKTLDPRRASVEEVADEDAPTPSSASLHEHSPIVILDDDEIAEETSEQELGA